MLRTSEYSERKRTPGSDSIIADVSGSGHLVSALITAHGAEGDIASCEGNVRVHIDGCRTPTIDSDGSESYTSYGWGFPTPPESNPASTYDGTKDYLEWCELRLCMSDPYYFGSRLRFGIESGEFNNRKMEHSGIIFYYGGTEKRAELIADLSPNLPQTASVTSVFESDDDDKPETFSGAQGNRLTFALHIPHGTRNVVLRRVADQTAGRQYADVSVDGVRITEYGWYSPDRNPIRKLFEDEFVIPSSHTDGKDRITVDICPSDKYGNRDFSVLELKAYAYM